MPGTLQPERQGKMIKNRWEYNRLWQQVEQEYIFAVSSIEEARLKNLAALKLLYKCLNARVRHKSTKIKPEND